MRGKLLRATLGVFLLTATLLLSVVAWLLEDSEDQRARDMEQQVTAQIASKARMLVDNHALALTGLVADTALGDIQALVQRAVEQDPDLVYGLLVDEDDQPWAYASSATRGMQLSPEAMLQRSREVPVPGGGWATREPRQRRTSLYGEEVLEVSRPIVDEGQLLGTICYGFSHAPLTRALARVRNESESNRRRMLLWIGLGVAASTLLGAVIMARLAQRITGPLGELTRAANAIADGQLEVRVQVSSQDELEVLAAAFNQMLRANEEAVRGARSARDAALEASRLKSEFLANMSHEIRTPMNGVIGMLQLMLQMPLDGKLRRYAETADSSAATLMIIINDVLDFSKLEAGVYEVSSVHFDPGMVLQEVGDLMASRAHPKGLDLICHRRREVPQSVLGDPDRYRQILSNLVGNAVKFTARGEVYVELAFERGDGDAGTLKTSVKDTGIGIAPEHHHRLFEAFTQVDGSVMRRYGGTGLGLAISRRLVEMMGGTIGVASAPGAGSEFWFSIPIRAARQPDGAGVIQRLAGKRALLVEPSARWCGVLEAHLAAWGLEATSVLDGRAAIAACQSPAALREPFDVAVIDAQRLDIGVDELVGRLRQAPEAATLPIIVLTQLDQGAALALAEREIAAQLLKPLRPKELLEALEGLFGDGVPARLSLRAPESRREVARRSVPLSPQPSGRAILIVDDNEINRFVAMEQVVRAGYEAITANDGADAVDKVKAQRFAAILMDCQMPVLDGYAAASEIRRWEGERSRVPIIALTAHALAGEREKVLAAGMDDYLTKPLRPQALARMLERYVQDDRITPVSGDTARPLADDTPELDPQLSRSRKLVGLFLARMPEQLDGLDAALAASDFEALARGAHKVKGGAIALGAGRMARVAALLEQQARAGDVPMLQGHAAAVRRHYQAAVALLGLEYPSMAPPRHSIPAA